MRPRPPASATVMPAERFESELRALLELYPNLYALDSAIALLAKIAPLRTVLDARLPIARLRMEKSPAEIAAIQKATDASIDAHRAAWQTHQAWPVRISDRGA